MRNLITHSMAAFLALNFSACIKEISPPANNDEPLTSIDDETGQSFPLTGYTKIGNDGSILADQSQAWNNQGSEAEGSQWSCVRDNDTGLYWEVKTNDDSLRDKDWVYTWYDSNPTSNAGFAGYPEGTRRCFNGQRCNSEDFISDVNTQQLCGFSDWRLPTGDEEKNSLSSAQELQSLFSCPQALQATDNCHDNDTNTINTAVFPHTPNQYFWSSSNDESNNRFAWLLQARTAEANVGTKNTKAAIRLVR